MGMIGNYVALSNTELSQILGGTLEIGEMDLDNRPNLDIDKAWQALAYLLTGEIDEGDPPMGYVVPMMADNAIDCDWDFGAFYLTPEQVAEAADYLRTLSDDELEELYDFDAMLEDSVYPVIEGEDPEEFYEYIHSNLLGIKSFYQEATEQGNAILFYIS